MDEQTPSTIWTNYHPWIAGFLGPIGAALAWAVRFAYVSKRQRKIDEDNEKRQRKIDEENERLRNNDFIIRDRTLLSDELNAMFVRLTTERDRADMEAAAARVEAVAARNECAQAWHVALSIRDWTVEQRHLANSSFQEMLMKWSAGEKPPTSMATWQMPPVPPIETFGKPQKQ